jgi:adenylate cyclase 10
LIGLHDVILIVVLFTKGCTFVVIFGLPGDKHDDDPARAVIAGYRIMETLHTVLEIT